VNEASVFGILWGAVEVRALDVVGFDDGLHTVLGSVPILSVGIVVGIWTRRACKDLMPHDCAKEEGP
jgi:hypothetical protein